MYVVLLLGGLCFTKIVDVECLVIFRLVCKCKQFACGEHSSNFLSFFLLLLLYIVKGVEEKKKKKRLG